MKKQTKSEKWYQGRLAKYFNEHYHEIEDEAEFYTDPDCNQWQFLIPKAGLVITFICHDDGTVSEKNRLV